MNPVVSTIVYFALGMVLCALGYKVFDLITPFDLNKEIDDHNTAAGVAVAGIFIAIAIVVSASIL